MAAVLVNFVVGLVWRHDTRLCEVSDEPLHRSSGRIDALMELKL